MAIHSILETFDRYKEINMIWISGKKLNSSLSQTDDLEILHYMIKEKKKPFILQRISIDDALSNCQKFNILVESGVQNLEKDHHQILINSKQQNIVQQIEKNLECHYQILLKGMRYIQLNYQNGKHLISIPSSPSKNQKLTVKI